ncbi:MAG: fluoride efflux transporter CrcB [Thermosynechococcaceae cyanobacterium]
MGVVKTLYLKVRTPMAIGLGAIAGALSRYYATVAITQWLGSDFPYGTWVVNLSGAFVMGFFITLALERRVIAPELRLMIAVGFLGSYTTFSTYELDAEQLLASSRWMLLPLYWSSSALLGVVNLELGSILARKVF